MRSNFVLAAAATAVLLCSCTKKDKTVQEAVKDRLPPLEERIAAFAPVEMRTDLSQLSERERLLVGKLVEAGKLADEIFWRQSSADAVRLRDSLRETSTPEAKNLYAHLLINYGPYDRIFDGARFVGAGPSSKPPTAALYPEDMTKEEFENWISAHPDQKTAFESQYSVIVRHADGLSAVPYHKAYPEVPRIAGLLNEAAGLADNPSLKRYLTLRAKALLSDDYYESDMAWLDLKDHNVDVVIGPIENYEDALFNYKTAYECAVVVKDPEGARELQIFKEHIDGFEHALPMDAKYKRKSAGSGNVLEIVNVVYFGGDFQAGVKTIAASLPNDPRVTQAKGGKKQMYKNLMEAKFQRILVPIAERILEPSLLKYVDRHAFTSFVTLHEISHTLGRATVYGKDELSVRRALKERYSAIEECKADVLGLYNNKVLLREGVVDEVALRNSIVTYVVGLYRSLRFGAEEAHGRANLIQLNFLREKGVVKTNPDGRIGVDVEGFLDALGLLAREVLTLQAVGDYSAAGKMIDTFGKMTPEIEEMIARVKDTRFITD